MTVAVRAAHCSSHCSSMPYAAAVTMKRLVASSAPTSVARRGSSGSQHAARIRSRRLRRCRPPERRALIIMVCNMVRRCAHAPAAGPNAASNRLSIAAIHTRISAADTPVGTAAADACADASACASPVVSRAAAASTFARPPRSVSAPPPLVAAHPHGGASSVCVDADRRVVARHTRCTRVAACRIVSASCAAAAAARSSLSLPANALCAAAIHLSPPSKPSTRTLSSSRRHVASACPHVSAVAAANT